MNHAHIEAFSQIPQPDRDSFGFIEDIKNPLSYCFKAGQGCDPGKTLNCMQDGVTLAVTYPRTPDFPDTAFMSLRRVLAAKGVTEKESGAYTITFALNEALSEEEFTLNVTAEGATLAAADSDGLRRGVYFLEDRICEAEGPSITEGSFQRKPFVKHRVSRCFFGPTNRAPFFIDELTNDVDYYPEEYLNKLAHEGVNGLWLTMYFRDLPSSIFPGRGQDAEKRFAKLRKTVEKCARYGVKIYVFLSEPKLFGPTHYAVPMEDTEAAPEVMQVREGKFGYFCTSSEAGRKYLEESMDCIFRNVPELGGVINIMLGEDNGSCVARQTTRDEGKISQHCPLCSKRDFADIYSDLARMYSDIIHKYNPKAEYIAWFYAPGQRDDSPFMKRLLHVAEKWPEGCSLMFNFESGGAAYQQGKKHTVFDYSLAYVGPSKLFAQSTEKAPRTAAKLQVGCSHEDASVPFIPVPENLYDKYKFMNEHGVTGAMQCWYFGNYPGLMNKAAGMLSFEPFPAKGIDFLEELARPDWRKFAPQTAKAWNYFSTAYRLFPANLSFEWYGPLHHSIAWPLHLFPVDEPISPSWILKNFPEVSGDRIGECLGYQHTLGEALDLCIEMSDTWQKGMEILSGLREEFKDDPARQADINLAQAVGLQMKSTRNLLQFYFWREEMLYNHVDHLAEMKQLVEDEIALSREMLSLCEVDCRLGYHSEAEGYLFFPAKLEGRIKLLQELLEEDFPRFRLDDPAFKEYSGETPSGKVAICYRKGAAQENTFDMGKDTSWQMSYDDDYFYFQVNNVKGNTFELVLEPCRLWTPYHMVVNKDLTCGLYSGIFPDMPEENVVFEGNNVKIRVERKLFEGFHRPGFPIRFNIYSAPQEEFSWCEPKLWPSRLQHGSYNPQTSGWIVLK